MTKLAKFLKFVMAIRVWKDGDGISFYWNWWHPLSWIVVPLVFVISIIMEGLPSTLETKSDIGIGVSEYWKNRKKEYL